MQISQKQIADALGVSIITVSRALRDHPDLATKTKARILQKAEELGYAKIRPQMQEGKHGKPTLQRAGILLYDSSHEGTKDPLASDVIRSIFLALQKRCRQLQIETLVEALGDGETPLIIKNRTIQAAFILGRYTKEGIQPLHDIPTIAVSSFIRSGLPRIVADNINGMRLATEHLIGLGHRNILFLSIRDPHTRLFEERADAYISTMHRNGLMPQVTMLKDHNERIDLAQLKNYTAIACASDGLAYTIQGYLLNNGIRIPKDCSIVGFDNLAAEQHPIKISTYAPDWDLMGKIAAELLLSRPIDIKGRDIAITIPGQFLVRNSTCPPARKTAT